RAFARSTSARLSIIRRNSRSGTPTPVILAHGGPRETGGLEHSPAPQGTPGLHQGVVDDLRECDRHASGGVLKGGADQTARLRSGGAGRLVVGEIQVQQSVRRSWAAVFLRPNLRLLEPNQVGELARQRELIGVSRFEGGQVGGIGIDEGDLGRPIRHGFGFPFRRVTSFPATMIVALAVEATSLE